jgi:hypothetical protein
MSLEPPKSPRIIQDRSAPGRIPPQAYMVALTSGQRTRRRAISRSCVRTKSLEAVCRRRQLGVSNTKHRDDVANIPSANLDSSQRSGSQLCGDAVGAGGSNSAASFQHVHECLIGRQLKPVSGNNAQPRRSCLGRDTRCRAAAAAENDLCRANAANALKRALPSRTWTVSPSRSCAAFRTLSPFPKRASVPSVRR